MTQGKAVHSPAGKRTQRTLAGTVPAPHDDARAHALTLYESALRLMQTGKYEAAHAAFNKLLAEGPPELGDRLRMYINACLLQVSKGKDRIPEP